jgi:hypothetical protein
LCRRVLTAPTEIPRRGDLDVGEVGEVEEGDGVALAGRQRGDRGEHLRAVPALLGAGRRGFRHRLERERCGRAPAAAGEVVADAAEPGAEGAVVAQGGEARERLQHRLLGDLGGGRGIAERAPAGAQQRGLVALHEHAEGGPVARAGGGGEVGVGRRGHTWIVPSGDGRVTRPLPSWIAA